MRFINNIILKYKHALLLIYYPIMFMQFQRLEERNVYVPNWIKSPIDDLIPFISIFVVPYVMWFGFVGITLFISGVKDKNEFIKLLMSLYIGMTICNIIYLIYPHGQQLRPILSANEPEAFDRLVYYIYSKDTPTNCFPSIHVLFSMASTITVQRMSFFDDKKILRLFAHMLNVMIVLSTVFIKQHSILDVIMGLMMSALIYMFVYLIDWQQIKNNISIRTNKGKAEEANL